MDDDGKNPNRAEFADAGRDPVQPWRIVLIVLTVALAAASFIDLPEDSCDGTSLFLQHLGTLALLLPLLIDLKLRTFSKPVCICVFLFICLHILGARHLYFVPYHEWAEQLFGWVIVKDEIHPNKFDRLVHFAFGLLLLPMFLRIAERRLKIRSYSVALLCAWLAIQCGSMLYEIFEWLLSVVMDGKHSNEYNGQQKDNWDAQKDMFLALLGSTVTAAFLVLRRRSAGRKK